MITRSKTNNVVAIAAVQITTAAIPLQVLPNVVLEYR
jgi:hypothetical protein